MRKARRDREWTQAELAARVGVKASIISAYEAGKIKPSYDVAIALANALGVPAEALFDELEVPV